MGGSTFAVWALVAASSVYWGLKLSSNSSAQAAPLATRTPAATDPAAVARLLGANPSAASTAPVASLASRFVLIGVVASPSHGGAALIAIDGKPAKPFQVGGAVDEGLVLQSVDARRAVLGASTDGPATVTLELPRRSP